MNKYELTVVLPGKTTAAKKKAITDKVSKVVDTLKGKILKTDDWGEIELAYKIAGNDSGIYMLLNLELEPNTVVALNDKLRVDEEIIRYLLVRKEN